jgi:hypothetical protein
VSEDERPDASVDLEGEILDERDLSAEEVAMHYEDSPDERSAE